jgi:hypothetical protein
MLFFTFFFLSFSFLLFYFCSFFLFFSPFLESPFFLPTYVSSRYKNKWICLESHDRPLSLPVSLAIGRNIYTCNSTARHLPTLFVV